MQQKKELDNERLVSQGLRSEIREKEERNQSIISDKDRLNDILSKAVDEKRGNWKSWQSIRRSWRKKMRKLLL